VIEEEAAESELDNIASALNTSNVDECHGEECDVDGIIYH